MMGKHNYYKSNPNLKQLNHHPQPKYTFPSYNTKLVLKKCILYSKHKRDTIKTRLHQIFGTYKTSYESSI